MNENFCHSVEKHRDCFNCIADLSQLLMDHGGVELFSVVYNNTIDNFDTEAGYF